MQCSNSQKQGIYHNKHSEEKENINIKFASFTPENSRALILDGQQFITTYKLLEKNCQIDIPQYNEEDYLAQEEEKPDNVNIYFSTINEFINGTKEKYDAVWLDYCCTYSGNSTCRPQVDIQTLFGKQLINSNAIFAITWTTQHMSEDNEFYNPANVRENIRELSGYRLKELYSLAYGSQMHVCMFRYI